METALITSGMPAVKDFDTYKLLLKILNRFNIESFAIVINQTAWIIRYRNKISNEVIDKLSKFIGIKVTRYSNRLTILIN